jgi:hypothetical protein
MILPFQGFNLLAGSVSDGVLGEPLLASFHEPFGPGVEGPGFYTLPSAEVADAVPLQIMVWSGRVWDDLS